MNDEQIKQLFIEQCLTEQDKVFLSNPLNTRHNAMYEAFKKGLLLGEKE